MRDEAHSPMFCDFHGAIIPIYSLIDNFAVDFTVFDPLRKEPPVKEHDQETVQPWNLKRIITSIKACVSRAVIWP